MRFPTRALLFLAASGILQAQKEFPKAPTVAPATGYSHVVVANPGKLIFLAGQVANDSAGQLVGKDDIKAQAQQVFENIKANLAAAGATFQDVVKLNWYIRDLKPEYLPIIREVRDRYVNKEHPPASTLVGVAALFREGYMLEVEAVATIPAKGGGRK